MSEHGGLEIDSDQYHRCDYCGQSGATAWIHGKVGIYDYTIQAVPLVAPPMNHVGTPDGQGELHLYLCDACLRASLSRLDPAPASS